MNCKEIVAAVLILILVADFVYNVVYRNELGKLAKHGALRLTGWIAIATCVMVLLAYRGAP